MPRKLTLECVYRRHREAYVGRPEWAWEDEGKWLAVADYFSSSGEFTGDDMEFARTYGLETEVADVLKDAQRYSGK